MNVKWVLQLPSEYKDDFYRIVNLESALRIRTVLAVLAFLQALQLFLYILGTDELLNDPVLILLKIVIIFLCIAYHITLAAIERGTPFFVKHAEGIVTFIVATIVCWSVFNTFKAQSITSDISVYMLVIFASVAVVRIRPWITAIILSANYLLFALGMPYFQKTPAYLTAHIMNAFILNIIALLIAYMFFKYSFTDYLDKQDIRIKSRELSLLAQHDGLTNLFNHKTIHELLETAIGNALGKNEPLSLVLIDLDNFKDINDRFGHQAGDSVLRSVSESIIRHIRQSDMAGRYGGDEFMIILPGINVNNAREIASRLLEDIRRDKVEDFYVTFSCGIAELSDERADQLVEKADNALYKCKRNGRNNIVITGEL